MCDSLLFSDVLGEKEEGSEMPMEDGSSGRMENGCSNRTDTQSGGTNEAAASVGRKQKNQKKKFDISLPAQHLVRSQLSFIG